MTAKYFALFLLVCAIGQPSEQAPDFLRDIKLKFKDIGKKITDGYRGAEKAVVNEYQKVEKTIKDQHKDVLGDIKLKFEDIGKKITDGYREAEKAVVNEYQKVEKNIKDQHKEAVQNIQNGFKAIEKAIQHACACKKYSCRCCIHLQQPEIQLNARICTNLTLLVREFGISFAVTLNDKEIFKRTVSPRNPPPVCLGKANLKNFADVCIRLNDINVMRSYLHVCISIEASINVGLRAKYDLGCINLGPPGAATGVVGAAGTKMGPVNSNGGKRPMTSQNRRNIRSMLMEDFDATTAGVVSAAGTELGPVNSNGGESPMIPQNMPNIWPMLTEDFDATTADAKLVEAAPEESGNLVIPVFASVGAIVLIIIVTLIVYTSIKKKRDEELLC